MVMASAEYIHYSGLGLNYTGSFIYLATYGYPYVYPHNYDVVMLLSSIDYHYLLNWKLMQEWNLVPGEYSSERSLTFLDFDLEKSDEIWMTEMVEFGHGH